MKNNLGKKILSVFLSVLMVVTMLPTFVITANADQTLFGNGVMSEYLTDSTKYGFSGTATWDDTEKGWSFDGSKYLKLDDAPLSTVTTSSGFAISFEVKLSNTALANKFFSFKNGSARISMDGGSPDWWTRYRTEISNGTNTRGYYTSDFTSGDFCSKTHTANGNDSYGIGVWYTMTVVMNPDGSYSYYRNGTLLATFKSNYISTGNGGSLTDESAAASVAGATDYIIGASDTSGTDGFTGYIRNFKIIPNVTSGSVGELALLIERYEAMMDGTVYTKMAPAYKAYVDACEAYDAIVYGGSTTANAQLSSAYSTLNTAIGNMTAWSAYSGTSSVTFGGAVNSAGYSNILFSDGNELWTSDWVTVENVKIKAIAPQTLVFYNNGVTDSMKFPIALEARATGKDRRRLQWAYFTSSGNSGSSYDNYPSEAPADSQLSFKQAWNGYVNDTFNWNNAYSGSSGSCHFGYYYNDTDSGYHDTEKDKDRYFANIGYVNMMSGHKDGLTLEFFQSERVKSGLIKYNRGWNYFPLATQIYVVNYKQLTDAINGSQKSYFSQVAKCKEGGMTDLLTKYDNATSYNITKYMAGYDGTTYLGGSDTTITADNAAAYYTYAQGACTRFASQITGASAPTTDADAQYKKLRNAIDLYAAPTGTAGSDVEGIKYSVRQLIADNGYVDTDNNGTKDTQLTGFGDFQTAYNNATGVMAALANNGDHLGSTSNYTDGSNAGTKATALLNAFNALNLVTLITPTININNGGGGAYIGKNNGVTITNNDSQTVQYSVRTSTDGGSSWGAWSSYADYTAELKPFSGLADNASKNNWAEYKTRSTDGSGHYSDESTVTQVKFLSMPTLASSSGNDELGAAGTVSLTSTNDAAGTLQYSYDNAEWHDYSAAIAPFTDNGTVSTITVYAREKKGTSYSPVAQATYHKSVLAPTFSVTDGAYLGESTAVTITNNAGNTESGAVTIDYHYGEDSYTTYSSALVPFGGTSADAGDASRTIHARATRNGKTAESAITVHYLARPAVVIGGTNNILTAADTVTVTNRSGATDGLKYSIDGTDVGNAVANGGTFAPFTLNGTATKLTVKVWQEKDGNKSPVYTATIYKKPTAPNITADGTYVDKTHGISAVLNDGSEDRASTIQYKIDGGSWTDYSAKVCPFSGADDGDGAASSTVYFRSKRTIDSTTAYSAEVSATVNYLARPSLNRDNNATLAADGTVSVTNESGATDGLKYSIDGTDVGTSVENGGSFAPFTLNGTATKLTVKAWQEKDGSKSPVKTITVYKNPAAPSHTADGTYLDKTHGITAALNNGNDDTTGVLQYKIGDGEWTNYSAKILPFSEAGDGDVTSSVTVSFRSIRTIDGVTAVSPEVSDTVRYLARPTLTFSGSPITDNQEFTDYNSISVDSGVSNAGTRKYYISDDNGTTWKEFSYSTSFAPFGMSGAGYDYTDDVTLKIKATEECDGSVSAETPTFTILLKKTAPLTIYYKPDASAQKDTTYYSPNGHIYVNTDTYEGCAIYYQTSVDGGAWSGFTSYSVNEGIDSDSFSSYTAVKVRFFVIENAEKTVFAQGTLVNSETYDDEVFRESFNHASVSGTTLTLSDGSTATLTAEGTASVVEGAGYVDGNGNSSDWRNNVLKINANSTAPGNSIQFAANPLADGANAASAQALGVTISFWRYLERGGTCTDLDATGDPTGYAWRNAIAFDDAWQNWEGYYFIEVNGVNSRCKQNNVHYYDYVQENQDPTGHAAGNARGNWVNVVITLDPNSGVMLYTNGEPHEMKAGYPKRVGDYSSMTEAEIAQDIINFITNSGTRMLFNYGEVKEGNDYDLYLDDVRIYTGVKTQLEINNMYIDADADVQSDLTSTSHDPTNVTVYTLAHNVSYTAPGDFPNDLPSSKSITLQAGTTVGQEVIDYCELNPVVGGGDVTAIDEYSFGTGMTVYHRNNTTKKWEVVGDDAGRCGYQNQKLFGAEYHTALAEPLAHAATDSSRVGAGHLVWAPHVMFNLYTGTWMYYGSTSSWGSGTSAIFLCDGAAGGSIEGPYTYRNIVYKSTGAPNAIDACVYYQYDSSGKPEPNYLYMAFGSWGGETCIALKTLYADGDALSANTGTNYNTAFDNIYLCNGINNTLEGASDGGSGEGAYIIYEKNAASSTGGYYYLYISYGQNTGSYLERVFRSEYPTSGFVGYNGVAALNNTTNATHGGQILAPFDLSNYDYLMVSTGHNSVYKTVNNAGDVVTVNSAHARPHANTDHGWQALPDGALATRQYDPGNPGSSPTGNINLVNLMAYTKQGWPVLMPFQYNGTDTVLFGENEITAKTIEGVYGANDLQLTEYYNYAQEYIYTIVKDKDDDMLAYEYGTDGAGRAFKDYIVLEKQSAGGGKYYYYARYYDESDFDKTNKVPISGRTPLYEGVIGRHGTNEYGITMICTSDYEYTWTHRISELPQTEDVESLGDSVSMDGVLYTHKAGDSYAKYGREISDDFLYGTNDLHQGERCTTITTTYPAKIDLSNPTAIYCQSDEQRCAEGEYIGGDFSAVALKNNKWFDKAGNQYTDTQAIARNGLGTGGASDPLKRLYGVTGFVSDYYFNASTGEYRDTGVKLIISYVDVENTSNKYSEYEFCYVMANPAMAHTIQGIRNQNDDYGDGDKRAGIILFDRFIGSSGAATTIGSNYVWHDSASVTDNNETHETGTYKFLDSFGSSASTGYDYSSPSKTAGAFDAFGPTVGVNSGSYGLLEHSDKTPKAYTVSSGVVDTDYYIDYSNTDNYRSNNPYGTITVDGSGRPTGYAFDFRTSNIKWASNTDKRWNATSYMLLTGDLKAKVTTDSTYDYDDSDGYKDTYVAQNSSSNEGRYTYGNLTDSEISALTLPDGTDTNYFKISGLGKNSTNGANQSCNQGNVENKYTLGFVNEENAVGNGRKVMSGYLSNMSAYDAAHPNNDYYTEGLQRALPLIDTGNTETNQWKMHITFSGTQSVAKNADPGSGDYERAEKYANFIIEQGIGVYSYFSVAYTWRNCNYEETYAYYNIGIHTCDKGAARHFADNYLGKCLAVTDNGDGTVTVKRNAATGAPIYLTEAGTETTNVELAADINPQHYTLSSYEKYVDAIAELNYFVNNPTNTTFKDYPAANRNTATEYVTAYTAGGVPIYKTETEGKNILNNSSTTTTDEVQAELIQKVITEYENLFKMEDYTEAADDYANIEMLDGTSEPATPADVDTIKIYSDKEAGTVAHTYEKAAFTDDSWAAFVALMGDISPAFDYRTDVSPRAENSWRHVELTGEEYRNLERILKKVEGTLMPVVEIDTLQSTYITKYGSDAVGSATGTVTGGIFNSSDEQVFTYKSWKDMSDTCGTAHSYLDSSAATYARAQSETVAGADIVNKGTGESDFTYTVGKYDVTGITKYTFEVDKETTVTFYAREFENDDDALSDTQSDVNTVNDTLYAMTLTAVDIPAAYESFDAADAVINALDNDRYTDAGKAIINTAKTNAEGAVYASAAELAAYNTAMGTNYDQTLKKTSTGETDTQTANLLTAVNTVNNEKDGSGDYKYIKYFKVTFTQQFSGVDSDIFSMSEDPEVYKAMYGEPVTLSVDESSNVVNWGVSIYNGEYADAFSEDPRSSQKISGVSRNTLTRVATNNMAITAEIELDSGSVGTNQYNLLDCYGHLVDVYYGSGLKYNGETVTVGNVSYVQNAVMQVTTDSDPITVNIKEVPFYNISGFDIIKKGDTEYTIKPLYAAIESYNFRIYDGTEGGNVISYVNYDKRVDIRVPESYDESFAAWAMKRGDKYQIASYIKAYHFFACENETYVMLLKDGDNYVTNEPTPVTITADKIDGLMTIPETFDTAAKKNAYVNSKIANRYPFVGVEAAKMEGNTKARVFVRVTAGYDSDVINSYGVLFRMHKTGATLDQETPKMVTGYTDADGATNRRAVANLLDTGQFTYTLNRKAGYNESVVFRAFVDYKYTYTATNTTGENVGEVNEEAEINALDYSNVMITNAPTAP